MNKKLLLAILVIVVITAFCFSYGDYNDEKNTFTDEKAIVEEGKSSYEVLAEEKEIVIYELKENEKTIIKRALYMPARENDLAVLKKGIMCETREEALKIFEDFVS